MPVKPSLQGFIHNTDGVFQVTERKAPYGKISGTMMAGLIGKSKWETPFTVTSKLLRLFTDDISDKREIKAGTIIEGPILKYLGAIPGDELFEQRKGDHEEWPSDFDDDTFAGHIDGMMPDGTLVEVKTTKNPEDWANGVPIHYHIQASLYAHFLKTDKILFAVGFTDDAILSDPASFVPSKDNVRLFNVGIIDGFDKMLVRAKQIYDNTVLKDVTADPDLDDPRDVRVYDILNAQLWDDDRLKVVIDELVQNQKVMDEAKAAEKRIQAIKECMVMYMNTHDVDIVRGTEMDAKITRSTRSVIDTDALKRDGLYDIYTKQVNIESIRTIKKR